MAEGAGDGYGKDWVKFPSDGKGSTPIELKKNLYAFSGAKTYANLEAINQLLYDNEGKLRPFNEFSQLAKSINRQYNVNYLQAEYQTARTAAQMAEKWERIQETKHLFPNLKYRTVGDSRVRKDHEKLNGIIRPIDDAFWDRHYPPLDWRCRCDAVPTAEEENQYDEKDLPPVQFKGNVGKDKEIFTKKGTFFKLAKTDERATLNLELSKLNAPYEIAFKSKAGKKLEVSIYHDTIDAERNLAIGEIVVRTQNINLSIRPDLQISKRKNPEFSDRKLLGDLTVKKSGNASKYVSNTFDSKYGKNGQLKEEEGSFVIMSLDQSNLLPQEFNGFCRQLWAKMKTYKNCTYVIVENWGKTVKVKRSELKDFASFEVSLTPIKDKRAE